MNQFTKVYSAVYDRLVNNPDVMNRITSVYDYESDAAVYPYAVLGDILIEPNETKTSMDQQIELTLNIRHEAQGKKELIAIAESIIASLSEDLSVEGVFLLSQNLKSFEVLQEEESKIYYGKIIYKFKIESEE
ncbi:DUF3168 domain-containing protein [Bacillus carboniphilus]|uniref:DUF3168 domain-containing protein n=1 Tax=Bacillus carboniphilus TaxID=86663 RepID=A0ABY9JQK0_9BACI|nr:DUF3168 domain-containing protein [Bacillus carboniphilus]WLR41674.1 DUF3168 domain-containing protein [Bacillus carboniphilus]